MRDHSGVPILATHDLFVLADLRGATIKLEGALAHQVRATIDVSSIRFCDKEMLARFSKIQYIAEYLKAKQEEVASWHAERGVDPASLADGRHLTNIGTFRAYVVAYLRHHPMLHQHMTLLVWASPDFPDTFGSPIMGSEVKHGVTTAVQSRVQD